MSETEHTVMDKTSELEAELKNTGLWQMRSPAWVDWFEDSSSMAQTDFIQWLQFIFIPNHVQKKNMISATEKKLLVPHAIRYFGDDVRKGKLLQILIELDSLL